MTREVVYKQTRENKKKKRNQDAAWHLHCREHQAFRIREMEHDNTCSIEMKWTRKPSVRSHLQHTMGRLQTELSHSLPHLSENWQQFFPFCCSVILSASVFSDKFFISHLTCLLCGGIGWSRRYCASHTFQQNREKTKQ